MTSQFSWKTRRGARRTQEGYREPEVPYFIEAYRLYSKRCKLCTVLYAAGLPFYFMTFGLGVLLELKIEDKLKEKTRREFLRFEPKSGYKALNVLVASYQAE